MDLKDKVAVITGGSGAIGSATAHRLAQAGARIVVGYNSSGCGGESAAGQNSTVIIAPSAPPQPRVETVPPPPQNPQIMSWQAGHWAWGGSAWVWEEGHYVQAPRPLRCGSRGIAPSSRVAATYGSTATGAASRFLSGALNRRRICPTGPRLFFSPE